MVIAITALSIMVIVGVCSWVAAHLLIVARPVKQMWPHNKLGRWRIGASSLYVHAYHRYQEVIFMIGEKGCTKENLKVMSKWHDTEWTINEEDPGLVRAWNIVSKRYSFRVNRILKSAAKAIHYQ